jgi:hypothetical protein
MNETIDYEEELFRGLTDQAAIECEEWEQQNKLKCTCLYCKTVWEDEIAMLTCPCQKLKKVIL